MVLTTACVRLTWGVNPINSRALLAFHYNSLYLFCLTLVAPLMASDVGGADLMEITLLHDVKMSWTVVINWNAVNDKERVAIICIELRVYICTAMDRDNVVITSLDKWGINDSLCWLSLDVQDMKNVVNIFFILFLIILFIHLFLGMLYSCQKSNSFVLLHIIEKFVYLVSLFF